MSQLCILLCANLNEYKSTMVVRATIWASVFQSLIYIFLKNYKEGMVVCVLYLTIYLTFMPYIEYNTVSYKGGAYTYEERERKQENYFVLR